MENSRYLREQQMISELKSTHMSSLKARQYIEFPVWVQNRYFLDIGSGTSTVAMDLARRGANVIAFDIRYRNRDELRASSDEHLVEFQSLLNDPALLKKDPHLRREYETMATDREQFFLNFNQGHRVNYVSGSLVALPFADRTFDFVYSLNCLTDYYTDPENFLLGVNEALRVAKSYAPVLISPWQDDYLSLGKGLPIAAQRDQQILAILRQRRIKYQIKRVRNNNMQYLQVSRY